MNSLDTPKIPGADAVVSWFGRWPSFHDAEVVRVHLNRAGRSVLSVHAWNMSKQTYAEDGQATFVLDKHAVVTFELESISALDLHDFNHQNVVFGLEAGRKGNGFYLELLPCFGLNGRVEAAQMSVSLTPGRPGDA